jgi:predicted Zn-dependent peptidase
MKNFLYQLIIFLVFVSCATTKTTTSLDDTDDDPGVSNVIENATADVLDRSVRPEPGPAPEIQLGKPGMFTLTNGLKVFVVENHKLPRVAFSLVLDLDPIFEGDKAGYISTAGQLMSRGTTSRSKAQIDQEVDFMGASLSTSGSGVYASSLTKHVENILELMADVTLRPSFSADELEKIKKETISALQANKDAPGAIASNVRGVLRYGKDHPYGELITEETVSRIDLEACKKYYETYFKPNVAYLAIVGDISMSKARQFAENYFGSWQPAEVPKFQYQKPQPPQETIVAMVDRPQSVQSTINITYPVELKRGHPDVLKSRVMNTILGGGGFSSYLMQNLRETQGYTYGAGSSLSSDRLIGSFNAAADVRNEVTDSAVVEFLYELRRIRNEPADEEHLQTIKNYITGSFGRSLESPSTIANFAINKDRYDLPEDYYSSYLKRIQEVTIDDVQEMAQKYIKPDNAYILVVGKASEVADGLKQFGKVQYYDIYGEPYNPTSAEDLLGEIDVNTIIDNYLDALGGVEILNTVKDITQVMKASMQGLELQITSIRKAPNMSFETVKAGDMEFQKQIFNGTKGVEVVQGQAKPLDDNRVQESMIESRIFPELSFEQLGVTLTLTGIEKVGEEESYVVEVELPSGKKSYSYFSKSTGLKLKESTTLDTPQGSITQSVVYQDYQEVDGVKYPHKASISMGPQVMDAKVASIEVNTGVSDDTFKVD